AFALASDRSVARPLRRHSYRRECAADSGDANDREHLRTQPRLRHARLWNRPFDEARVLTVARQSKKARGDKLAEQLATGLRIEPPETLRLLAREAQSRHFEIFT